MKLIYLLLSFLLVLYHCEGRTQCMSVRGHVKCGSHHSAPGSIGGALGGIHRDPVFIKLIDEDTGGPDDWMDETYASLTGAFQLHGCASDGPLGGAIEPMLRIYHKCKGAAKRVTVTIPPEFIGKEYNLTTVFNLGGPLPEEVDERYPVQPCGKKNKFYLF